MQTGNFRPGWLSVKNGKLRGRLHAVQERRAGSDLVDSVGRDEVAGRRLRDGHRTRSPRPVADELQDVLRLLGPVRGCAPEHSRLYCLRRFPGRVAGTERGGGGGSDPDRVSRSTATIPPFCKLDRKNYFYPDLPKGYQISQYDLPFGGRWISRVRFRWARRGGRASPACTSKRTLAGSSTAPATMAQRSASIDLNRSGVPLMEIVGEPHLRSPEEARDYLTALRQILRYIGVSTGNMEEGAFRCDANVSVREIDGPLGAKVEVKNMNSFRAVERALRFEQDRQLEILRSRRACRTGDPGLGRRPRRDGRPSGRRNRHTTTAIFRSRICRHWRSRKRW